MDYDLEFGPDPDLDPDLDPAEFADYDGHDRADNDPEDLMDPDLDPAEFAYVDADDQAADSNRHPVAVVDDTGTASME